MILNRLGKKNGKTAKKIISLFPNHIVYVEPFFGAGGMFFSKPIAKYNIVNDSDKEIFNLYNVILNSKQELAELILITPVSSTLHEYWKKNKEKEPVKQAMRFLFLSNYVRPTTSDLNRGVYINVKSIALEKLEQTYKALLTINMQLFCEDFRKTISRVSFRKTSPLERVNTFFYADPPYLGTANNYEHSFKQQDTEDLMNELIATKCKFAISEFDSKIVVEMAKAKKLNINIIGERTNLKNRRTEILITNYRTKKTTQQLIFKTK